MKEMNIPENYNINNNNFVNQIKFFYTAFYKLKGSFLFVL